MLTPTRPPADATEGADGLREFIRPALGTPLRSRGQTRFDELKSGEEVVHLGAVAHDQVTAAGQLALEFFDQRVVVDTDDARRRVVALRHVVGVVDGGQPGADVEGGAVTRVSQSVP